MSEQDTDEQSPWYEEGLRFACTMCGNCCTGPPGAVWFDQAEGESMAQALGMEHSAFLKQYARRISGKWSLKEHRTKHGYDCILLDRSTQPGKALCRVYKARPTQCRTWPFWPENLEDYEAWDDVRRETPCPGMGSTAKSAFVPLKVIVERLEEQKEASRRSADPDW